MKREKARLVRYNNLYCYQLLVINWLNQYLFKWIFKLKTAFYKIRLRKGRKRETISKAYLPLVIRNQYADLKKSLVGQMHLPKQLEKRVTWMEWMKRYRIITPHITLGLT